MLLKQQLLVMQLLGAQALMTDQVDCIDDVSAPTANLLKRNANLELFLAVTSTEYLQCVDTPPFDNNDVRLALKYAARYEMVDKVLLGYGQIGNDHSISPTQKYFNTELVVREFDAEKSKVSLEENRMVTASCCSRFRCIT